MIWSGERTPAGSQRHDRTAWDSRPAGFPEHEWLSSANLAAVAPLSAAGVGWARQQVVVVSPHPDDGIFGAGGFLQWASGVGAGIEVVSVTDGDTAAVPSPAKRTYLARRRQLESRVARYRLGLGPVGVTRLGLAGGEVDDESDLLAEVLDELLREGGLCLAPWWHDGHPDHDAAGRVSAEVCAGRGAVLLGYLVDAWQWADPGADDLPWVQCRRWRLTPLERARKRYATEAFDTLTARSGPQLARPGSGCHLADTDRARRSGRRPMAPATLETAPAPSVLRRFWRPFEVFVRADGLG